MKNYSDMTQVICGVGGNQPNTPQAFSQLLNEIHQIMHNVMVSQVYTTEPMDYLDQPLFLNWCFSGNTAIQPAELIDRLLSIEKKLGRQRTIANGPRIIDIDVLLYGNQCINHPRIEVPHPRMHNRAFVLVPLIELYPEAKHPATGVFYRDYLNNLPEQGIYSMGLYPYNL